MYRITRRLQRQKVKSEIHRVYSCLPPDVLRENLVEPIIRIDETVIQPEQEISFGPLDQTEILTCVLEGEAEVRTEDLLSCRVGPRQLHYYCSGDTEAIHWRNPRTDVPSHTLEIWLRSAEGAEKKTSEVASFDAVPGRQPLVAVASGQGHEGAVKLAHDCAIYLSRLRPNENLIFETVSSRQALLIVLIGAIRVEQHRLLPFDLGMVQWESQIDICAQQSTSLLLIDLPGRPVEAEDAGFESEQPPARPFRERR